MGDELAGAFEAHFRLQRAIDAAWRRIVRHRDEPEIALGPIIDGVMAKAALSSEATREEVRSELGRRIVRYRPRRKHSA